MTLSKMAVNMLKDIDGLHKSMIEFEERCALRSFARRGVKVTFDEHGVCRVDWTTVVVATDTK